MGDFTGDKSVGGVELFMGRNYSFYSSPIVGPVHNECATAMWQYDPSQLVPKYFLGSFNNEIIRFIVLFQNLTTFEYVLF